MLETITPPAPIRAINYLGSILSRVGLNYPSLDPSRLEREAVKKTGLSNFGSPNYREGLERACASLESDAGLSTLGRLILAQTLTGALETRLLHVHRMQTRPAAAARPPLVIMGLPRSGTTFLHRACTQVRQARGLENWELQRPHPYLGGPDDRFVDVERGLAKMHALAPMLDAKHYVRAGLADECRMLLDPSLESLTFAVMAPASSYLEWFMGRDLEAAYRIWAEFLDCYQEQTPDKRLTLKAPMHAGNLRALKAASPNAMLVQTHRDPKSVVGSACSLLHTFHGITTRRVDAAELGATWVDMLARYTVKNNLERESVEVYDVYYEDLVRDPVGVVRSVHEHYGLTFDEEDERRVRHWVEHRPKNKYGVHRYALEDFGLSPELVDRQFGPYYRAHPRLRAHDTTRGGERDDARGEQSSRADIPRVVAGP